MLTYFYLDKSWREQKKPLIIVPLIAFAVAIALAATVYIFPDALTGPTLSAIREEAQSAGSGADPESALIIGAIVSQAPLLAALFAALVGANISIGMTDIEVRSGALEVVLSRGYRMAGIVRSLAIVAGLLGLLSTAVIVVGLFAASWGALSQLDFSGQLPWRVLVLPWPCLAMGIACGLAIQLLLPNLSRVRAGTSGNIAQLLALLPTLIIFLLFTFSAEAASKPAVTWIVSIAFTVIALVLMFFVARSVDIAKLLKQ